MMRTFKIYAVLLSALLLLSFTHSSTINKCFISFKEHGRLKASEPEQLPADAEKTRPLNTGKGVVNVSCVDGYRVLYERDETALVNLKVERSAQGSYKADQEAIIANLTYLATQSANMEKKLTELEFNGYKIYGISRESIKTISSTLGIFVMFPGDDITVYFYFNNSPPTLQVFESTEDYKKQRDSFMQAYAGHLRSCQQK